MSDLKAFADPDYLPCMRCGYDLRATRGDACPECGTPASTDRSQSGLPWAHRQSLGRLNAFVRTAWWATAQPARLAADAARPQLAPDAAAFARATVAAVWVPGVAMIVGYALARDGLDLKPLLMQFGPIAVWPEIALLLSAVAGWTIFAAVFGGVQVYWFDLRRLPDTLRGRAVSLGRYCSAGWGLAGIPLAGLGAIRVLLDLNDAGLMTPGMISIVTAASAASALLIAGLVLRSTLVVLTRLTACGWPSKLGLLLGLPAVYLSVAMLCVIVLPGICLLWMLMVLSLR